MLDPGLRPPVAGRTFTAERRLRLSDRDRSGRARLDALARLLQDTAIDDVQETGWGVPDHLWFVRRIRLDVLAPFVADERLELVTWCSGVVSIAAGRRWSVRGDRGGRAEVDSVWIHLGPDKRPARIEDFEIYAAAAGGRIVSTKLELAPPCRPFDGQHWQLRSADVDAHGHVNNAVYWQAVEDRAAASGPDLAAPHRALLEYREPVALADELELAARHDEEGLAIGFMVAGRARAVARVEPLHPT